MSEGHWLWAVALGALSAAALPLGAWFGLTLRLPPAATAVFASFGAGALIAALSLELVAPTVAELGHDAHGAGVLVTLLVASGIGGVLFTLLDRMLASRGGFLRKVSTTMMHFAALDRERDATRVRELCAIPLLWTLPEREVSKAVHDVAELTYAPSEVLFAEGDAGDHIAIVRSGEVRLWRAGGSIGTVGPGAILGELAVLTEGPHSLSATAVDEVEVLTIPRAAIEAWRTRHPAFDAALREIGSEHLRDVRQRDAIRSREEEDWAMRAIDALATGGRVPTPTEWRREAENHTGSGLAVWLGLLIDGIPESFVIGAGLLGLVSAELAANGSVAFANVIPFTLVGGLFLANFPEALSSSVAMRDQGFSPTRIHLLWGSLVAVTAVGAGFGYVLGASTTHATLVAVEGIAAGAMLASIASTMIPEAVHLAGSGRLVGLSTLAGFLAAVAFKLLEH
ncbi:MAG: cyclic nucleotide-binding domain-containing protein [Myxococcota bacterium]